MMPGSRGSALFRGPKFRAHDGVKGLSALLAALFNGSALWKLYVFQQGGLLVKSTLTL